jgi:hypothetical protein
LPSASGETMAASGDSMAIRPRRSSATSDILIPSEHQHEEYAILDSIRRGAQIERFETVRRRKDASVVDVSLTTSPMRGEPRKIVGASTIARDSTDRKKSEVRINVLAREAEPEPKTCWRMCWR